MTINLSALQKQRRDTAANWTAENPTLLAGEIGLESDTGYWKVGDGATAWTSLAYVSGLGAEIPVDRLADGAARQLLQTDVAGTGVEWTDNVDVPGTLDVTGTGTFDGNVTIAGDLTVNGTTTTINTQDLLVEDKNVVIGNVTTPSDVTADGGGITLKGTTDKTINWVDATDAWTLSEHVDLASGKEYRINGTNVLDATSLGSGVTSSSLTSVGTIGTGTWQGTTVATGYGGTGQTTYTDGQLLIGKTDGTLAKATITQGSGVTITNGDGTITIAATGSGGTVTAVTGTSPIASTGGTTPDISIQDGTTAQKGAVQLEDSTSSTSTTTAATPNAVKSAYDLANAALPASGGTLTGDVTLNAQSDLRFADADSSNWVAFQAPATVASNVTWTLPDADGTSGQVLSTNGSGTLSWATTDKIEEGNTSAEVIDTGSDGRFVVTTEGTERLRVTNTGAVGIGTSSPSHLLHVAGNTLFGANASVAARFNSANNTQLMVYSDAANQVNIEAFQADDATTKYDIYFNKYGGNSFFGGNVGIGTTSPAYQLQLGTDSAGKPSTNTWTIVSDERIKEEIELADLDLCYEAIKNIPLKRFKWKDEVYTEEQAYDRRKLGWIAQDVEAVFPKAVRQHEFRYNQVFEEVVIPAVPAELDGDGNIITEEQPERIEKGELISEEVIEDCRDLNSDQLYAAMYGAIQKLISKVETLEAEVAALKAQ